MLRVKKKKKYECRGGAVVLWGMQKIKGKKEDRGARVRPWCNWVWA